MATDDDDDVATMPPMPMPPPPSPLSPSPPPSPLTLLDEDSPSPPPSPPPASPRWEHVRGVRELRLGLGPGANSRAPRVDAARFTEVLYSCVGQVGHGAAGVRPACDRLHRVEEGDVGAFRHEQPQASDELEDHLSAALAKLGSPDAYRAVGLYLALLTQDIDLARSSTGSLGRGKAAETAARLAAIVRQSLRVRDDRHHQALPPWALAVMVVLGGLLLLLLVGLAVAYTVIVREE